MDKYLNVAISAAKEAGKIHKKYFRSDLKIRTKSNSFDLLTVADVEAEKNKEHKIKKWAFANAMMLRVFYGNIEVPKSDLKKHALQERVDKKFSEYDSPLVKKLLYDTLYAIGVVEKIIKSNIQFSRAKFPDISMTTEDKIAYSVMQQLFETVFLAEQVKGLIMIGKYRIEDPPRHKYPYNFWQAVALGIEKYKNKYPIIEKLATHSEKVTKDLYDNFERYQQEAQKDTAAGTFVE